MPFSELQAEKEALEEAEKKKKAKEEEVNNLTFIYFITLSND